MVTFLPLMVQSAVPGGLGRLLLSSCCGCGWVWAEGVGIGCGLGGSSEHRLRQDKRREHEDGESKCGKMFAGHDECPF